MKVLGVQFDYGERDDYARLCSVFEKSVKRNCPTADLTIVRMKAPAETKRNKGMTSNHEKFKVWNQFVQEADRGEHIILMDVDMLVLADMAPAFDEEFDIGITRRTSTTWPYNGGVVFVKVNGTSRAFVKQWGEIDAKMYTDSKFHDPYKKAYKGQNQASLGWMVEQNEPGAVIKEFPCAVWNACNEDWMRLNLGHTRAVHIKSTLRHYCLGRTSGMPSKMRHICKRWREYEASE
jgi:hypothetical protein